MAADNKGKKRKQRYLPHNKPVKKKGSYPLRPGVQGFFITCDGGREHQASREAVHVIESFYEELVHKEDSVINKDETSNKPLNTKIKFSYSDSSSSDDDEDEDEVENEESEEEESGEKDIKELKSDMGNCDDNKLYNKTGEKSDPQITQDLDCKKEEVQKVNNDGGKVENHHDEAREAVEPPAKKQCLKTEDPKCDNSERVEMSVDRLIEAELEELGDKNKWRFIRLDSGCNGVVFVQMRKKDGDPSPKDIAEHLVSSAASTRKHMSRFILRVLPVEVACYASEEDILRAIKPLVEQYFPVETPNPRKFAVLYEARANTGVDRMKIINAVAKSVPAPHKVDLSNPHVTIMVEIVKTVCLIGIVEKYKEYAKYNLRQLTSAKP